MYGYFIDLLLYGSAMLLHHEMGISQNLAAPVSYFELDTKYQNPVKRRAHLTVDTPGNKV